MARRPKPVAERFAGHITPEPNTGCRLWTAATDKDGYGLFTVSYRKMERAHRFAWRMVNGPIPDGLDVLHHCDTPGCVFADADPAVSHLFLGTNADNAADRDAKGRGNAACGDRHYSRRHPELRPRGDRHGRRKLTEEQARGVIARLKAGEMQSVIADDLGVSRSAINLIASGHNWSHLPR